MTGKFAIIPSLAVTAFAFNASAATVTQEQVVEHYADIAHAVFADALVTAKSLDQSIDQFLAAPSAKGFEDVKQAWIDSRVPYQQSEVFRFGNAIVDDWEGQLNAWPLDEGLIDYVATDTNMSWVTKAQARTS